MGWWHVEGTKTLIGDTPVGTLRDALFEIAGQYQSALRRPPTKAEWEALLVAAFGTADPEHKLLATGAVKKAIVEVG